MGKDRINGLLPNECIYLDESSEVLTEPPDEAVFFNFSVLPDRDMEAPLEALARISEDLFDFSDMLDPLDASTEKILPLASFTEIELPLEESASKSPLRLTTVTLAPLEASRESKPHERFSIFR